MSLINILSYLVRFQVDTIGLVIAAGLALWYCHRFVRRRQPGETLPRWLLLPVVGIVVLGTSLAEWAGWQQRNSLVTAFSGLGATYAFELQHAGHAAINFQTAADDPDYLRLIELEKSWLKINPFIADVYTFRLDPQGRIRLLVDSETDYDHNGVYEGEREQRTPIGEIYKEATENFFKAARGEPAFDTDFTPDRWGVWVSSLHPIFDATGRVEGAVGIDYPADHWLKAILVVRAIPLGTGVFLLAVLLTASTLLTLMRAEIRIRKDAEEQLQRARQAADDANHAKGEFLAVMSHEIRTPLTGVLGFSDMLAETELTPLQHRFVSTIQTGGKRLLSLLNDILDFSKIEEGRLELESLPYSPAQAVQDTLDLLASKALAKKQAVRFDNQIGGPLEIMGDSHRFSQIISNLVGNAIKFTGNEGGISVRATWRSGGPNAAGELTVSVIDSGVGISAEDARNLFQMFTQANASITRHYGGTGLGLAICQRLVQQMGGRIAVTSEVGKGSAFTFSFPATAVLPPEIPVEQPPLPSLACSAGSILIVDDHASNRQVLELFVRQQGFDPVSVSTGSEAIAQATTNTYAAILLDLQLPDIDAFAMTRHIRENEPDGQRVPILALAASGLTDVHGQCQAAGIDAYLTKPLKLESFQAELTKLLASPVAVG